MSKIRYIALCSGFALEAYDWVLYALLLSYIAPTFFGADLQRSLIYGFGVFAAGFLTRPIGGLIIGRFADTRGRKPAMCWCLVGAGLADVGMAVTPGTATIGFAAPLLALFWRASVGFSYGGEVPLGQSYMHEITPPARRGIGASLLEVANGLGALSASLITLVLVVVLGPHGMSAGGWRIPFVVAAVGSFTFAILRRGLSESHEFEANRQQGETYSWWAARRELMVPMLMVAGTTAGVLTVSYLWSAVPTTYAIRELNLNNIAVLGSACVSTAVCTAGYVFFGRLGDRIGCRRLMVIAALVCAAANVPLLHVLDHASIIAFWIFQLATAVLGAALAAVMPTVLSSMVPGRYRVAAQALPYTLAVTLFGGTSPLLEQLTRSVPTVFAVYVSVMLLISAATLIWSGTRSTEPERPRPQPVLE